MSTADATLTGSMATFQQQGLAVLKETQDYAVRLTEIAAEHPLFGALRVAPPATELIDSSFGFALQALELQRELVGRIAAVAAPAAE